MAGVKHVAVVVDIARGSTNCDVSKGWASQWRTFGWYELKITVYLFGTRWRTELNVIYSGTLCFLFSRYGNSDYASASLSAILFAPAKYTGVSVMNEAIRNYYTLSQTRAPWFTIL
jgi:hypothetical protein